MREMITNALIAVVGWLIIVYLIAVMVIAPVLVIGGLIYSLTLLTALLKGCL